MGSVSTVHPTGAATPMVLNPAMQEYLESIGTKSGGGGDALPVAMIEPADVSNAMRGSSRTPLGT